MEDITLALPVNPYVRTSTILRDVTSDVGLGGFRASLLAFTDYDGDSLVDILARGTDEHGGSRLEAWLWVRNCRRACTRTPSGHASRASPGHAATPEHALPATTPVRRGPTSCASSPGRIGAGRSLG